MWQNIDMDAYDILVIVLSVTLAILLTLCIALVIIMIRIFRRIDSISQKAENFADNMQEASEFFRNASAPIAASKMIANIIEWARKSSKNKEE